MFACMLAALVGTGCVWCMCLGLHRGSISFLCCRCTASMHTMHRHGTCAWAAGPPSDSTVNVQLEEGFEDCIDEIMDCAMSTHQPPVNSCKPNVNPVLMPTHVTPVSTTMSPNISPMLTHASPMLTLCQLMSTPMSTHVNPCQTMSNPCWSHDGQC